MGFLFSMGLLDFVFLLVCVIVWDGRYLPIILVMCVSFSFLLLVKFYFLVLSLLVFVLFFFSMFLLVSNPML